MKSIYESMLARLAPIELCRAFYKTSAVKSLVQLTEGPLPTGKRETEHIDYAAGLAAKELLMKKLERG
jgi:hypothetical protein